MHPAEKTIIFILENAAAGNFGLKVSSVEAQSLLDEFRKTLPQDPLAGIPIEYPKSKLPTGQAKPNDEVPQKTVTEKSASS